MNKNQVEERTNEAQGAFTEVSGNKGTGYKGKADKHDSKSGSVLSDINDDAAKHGRKDSAESGEADKRGEKDGAVLSHINDDGKK